MASINQQTMPSPQNDITTPLQMTQHQKRATGLWQQSLRQLRQNRLAIVGLVILVLAIVAALFAPWLVTHSPRAISARDRFTGVSIHHFMGTDNLGRDIYSRVIYGIRMSAIVAGLSISVATLVGVILGLISGYFGNWADEVLMRVMDIIYAFPPLLLALTMVATFGTGLRGIIFAIAVGRIPGFARVTRAAVLSIRESEYLEAARTIGLPDWRIIWRHVLPNALAPIIVMVSISLALAILVEASLSFLGLGIQPPTPSLGGLLKDSLPFMRQAPWMAIFPGLTIAAIVFALNVLGDGLRDALDPNLQ